jgi:hypothetical protein
MRRLLRRFTHFAHVRNPTEMRMGSPQYGELILDGEPIANDIEYESLIWSDGRRLLAGQQLVSWGKGPRTRVLVIDADRRAELAATPHAQGLCNPVRFEDDVLVYRLWHHERGERELRLTLDLEEPAEKRKQRPEKRPPP